MTRQLVAALAVVSLVGLGACEKRARQTGAGSLLDPSPSTAMGSINVYRFAGVEQSLADARRAVLEERWDQAIAAAEALLVQQPGNPEAQSIRNQARLELPNRQHYLDFTKAAGANEVANAVKHHRQIAEGSLYREKAKVQYERLRTVYLDNQDNDARALARAGRCDEARRTARVTMEWFPDARGRMDDVAVGCKQARGEPEAAAETAATEKKVEPELAALAVARTPVVAPPPGPAGARLAAELARQAAPQPPRQALAAPMALAATRAVTSLAPAAVELAPAAPVLPPRNLPPGELEKLRESGDATPALPAGARMIAHRDGVKRISMAVKFCVSEQGVPTTVSLLKSSDYSDANEKVVAEVRRWRFRPVVANGVAVPACSGAFMNYAME